MSLLERRYGARCLFPGCGVVRDYHDLIPKDHAYIGPGQDPKRVPTLSPFTQRALRRELPGKLTS